MKKWYDVLLWKKLIRSPGLLRTKKSAHKLFPIFLKKSCIFPLLLNHDPSFLICTKPFSHRVTFKICPLFTPMALRLARMSRRIVDSQSSNTPNKRPYCKYLENWQYLIYQTPITLPHLHLNEPCHTITSTKTPLIALSCQNTHNLIMYYCIVERAFLPFFSKPHSLD